MSVEIKKILPCIATTVKNGVTQYLLDKNNNLVFWEQVNERLISLNIEYIQNCYNNNIILELDNHFYNN
jgi:hypothetical protein